MKADEGERPRLELFDKDFVTTLYDKYFADPTDADVSTCWDALGKAYNSGVALSAVDVHGSGELRRTVDGLRDAVLNAYVKSIHFLTHPTLINALAGAYLDQEKFLKEMTCEEFGDIYKTLERALCEFTANSTPLLEHLVELQEVLEGKTEGRPKSLPQTKWIIHTLNGAFSKLTPPNMYSDDAEQSESQHRAEFIYEVLIRIESDLNALYVRDAEYKRRVFDRALIRWETENESNGDARGKASMIAALEKLRKQSESLALRQSEIALDELGTTESDKIRKITSIMNEMLEMHGPVS